MTGWPRTRAAALLAPFLTVLATGAGAAYAAPDDPVPSRTLFTIDDDEVFESSGLVDTGRVVYTINDSGDDAVVYGLDPGTGRPVSRTTYAGSVEDVEAIAPGRDGRVWVGDIGDNRRRRDDVTVYRVDPRDGEHPATPHRLTYPDGAHDAETLLVHPRTGRVFVVSKSPFGGTVYAAPRTLSGAATDRLTSFARVSGLVTDGTFFAGGRRVLLRTYGTASVYTFPGFALVGTVRLPAQRQGEGISVSPQGRVLVSSEGPRSDVLEVTLPAALTDPSATPAAAPLGPGPTRDPQRPGDRPPRDRTAEEWGWVALASVGVLSLGYLTLRAVRPRGPRRR
ncbi:esterase-like activity of phytase family protein [Nocardioides panacis]|uniref:Esterase-like activity of phytase family protein n=1 Tax=Nocardioides panacis TaxID=2849501 RepID=A0A975Y099_9ACTN|nr:esterase-like activity of phytase family protein [Nocardioides panacis]QWZ08243.1 esterase-like activity of phytase family protein [Nocardioides panacis]